METLRKWALALGALGCVVTLNALVWDSFCAEADDGLRVEVGTALATALAAYISALLGLDSQGLAARFQADDKVVLAMHVLLFVGYVVAVGIAFAGFLSNEDPAPLIRSVVGTAVATMVAIVGLLAAQARPEQKGER